MSDADRPESRHARDRAEDRRSSVRVRSRLPCAVEPITDEEIEELEARILDAAVLESDGVMSDAVDWRDHAEDLSNEMVFVLNEIRALRQQVTEVQRVLERRDRADLQRRWVELNVNGLWIGTEELNRQWEAGQFASIRVQIPSMHTPEVLAVGEVVRVDDTSERTGVAFEFRSISEPHKRAIAGYALRRERQKARSERLDIDFD